MDRYTVISPFVDLQDSSHVYRTGDDYTYDGHAVSSRRLEELSTAKNKLGKPLISKIDPIEVSGTPKKLKKRGKRVEVDPLPEPDESSISEDTENEHGIESAEDGENPLGVESSEPLEGGDISDD